MKNRTKVGVTLIELLVGLAICAILIALAFPIARAVFYGGSKHQETVVTEYVKQMYPEATDIRVRAATRDSDSNGYVSVSVTYLDSRIEHRETLALEASTWNDDVRVAKATISPN